MLASGALAIDLLVAPRTNAQSVIAPKKMRNNVNIVTVKDWGTHINSLFIMRLLKGLFSCLLSDWATPKAITNSSFAYTIFRNYLKAVENKNKNKKNSIYYVFCIQNETQSHIAFSRQNKPAKQVLNVCLPKRHTVTSWIHLTGSFNSLNSAINSCSRVINCKGQRFRFCFKFFYLSSEFSISFRNTLLIIYFTLSGLGRRLDLKD